MNTDIEDELVEAVHANVDPSFDASTPVKSFGANRVAARRSGSERTGFYRPGERAAQDGAPFEVLPTKCPQYSGPPSGRVPTNDEKRGAWHLQHEYLATRLGKNEEENSRLWNTAKWIDRLYRIATTPAEAISPFNIYVADAILQDTGAPSGPDDESPDAKPENEGVKFERIIVGKADSTRSMKVMDKDGVTRRLEIGTDDFTLLRLVDELDECDALAKIDINDLAGKPDPLPEQIDFPGPIERQTAIKLIRMLMVGMGPLWHPVIRAIADHVTMNSLGKSEGVGDDKAATVGRWRVIDGLRLAESIRKRVARSKEHLAVDEAKHWPARRARQRHMSFMDNFISEILVLIADKPLAANDNHPFATIALIAA
jgi:hypothetical protein